jgi:hypothetical protein
MTLLCSKLLLWRYSESVNVIKQDVHQGHQSHTFHENEPWSKLINCCVCLCLYIQPHAGKWKVMTNFWISGTHVINNNVCVCVCVCLSLYICIYSHMQGNEKGMEDVLDVWNTCFINNTLCVPSSPQWLVSNLSNIYNL